jgi:dTDP-L-rhamnose 4-epimerase
VVARAIKCIDVIYHFAASVGVGQSMYKIRHYSDVNALGTAVLLEALAHTPISRLIVASSMSIYGEGLYKTSKGNLVENAVRSRSQLRKRQWDLSDGNGEMLAPVATPENKTPAVPSVYALSKYYQERLCFDVAPAHGISVVGLRFFNIFGTRQSLSNPYTGVLAIFAARLLSNRAPIVYEDGKQRRDFVFIDDVVQACRLALLVPAADGHVFNIGSGRSSSILEVAKKLADALGKPGLEPEISGQYRVGDIRNCFADISLARNLLGYAPGCTLEGGLLSLVDWLVEQEPSERDLVSIAARELTERGLAA